MFRIIASGSSDKFKGYGLVGYTSSEVKPEYYFEFEKCWVVDIDNDENILKIKEFLVHMIPSFYAHCLGTYSCDLDCPKHIEEALIPLINVNEFSEEEMSMEDRPFIAGLKRMRNRQKSKEIERN